MRANKVVDLISKRLEQLPGNLQAEVLDFVQHLETKRLAQETERQEWLQFSLENALKNMETEEIEYLAEDVREQF